MAAALVGTFGATETSSTSATSGSRTTTAGNLIVGFGGSWNSADTITLAISDSKSNTITEAGEIGFRDGINASYARNVLAYNANGTRGASHTVTNTRTGGSGAVTVGGAEFSGVDAAPSVVTNTASGTSTAPSVAATAGAASLYVATFGYNAGAPTTITPGASWLTALEVDENNDQQSCACYYRVTLTGANTASATLGASSAWGAIVATFTESGGAAATIVPPSLHVLQAVKRASYY